MTAGWMLLGLAVVFLLWTARLDRMVRKYRRPAIPRAAYRGPVGRWRREYYSEEGYGLLVRTRWTFALFCAAAVAGALMLEAAR